MPVPENRNDSAEILAALRSTDPELRQHLFDRLYDELKAIASNRLQAAGQSLQTTELVHEVYLKLVDANSGTFNDRTHFCAVAARAMRQILVDRARAKKRIKRGGGQAPASLDESFVVVLDEAVDVLALDEALEELATHSKRLAQVVELRSFGGLTVEETAAVLEVSTRSVKADWRTARAWLRRFLSPPSKTGHTGENPQGSAGD